MMIAPKEVALIVMLVLQRRKKLFKTSFIGQIYKVCLSRSSCFLIFSTRTERSSLRVIHVQNQAIISTNMNAKRSLLCKWSVPDPEAL